MFSLIVTMLKAIKNDFFREALKHFLFFKLKFSVVNHAIVSKKIS